MVKSGARIWSDIVWAVFGLLALISVVETLRKLSHTQWLPILAVTILGVGVGILACFLARRGGIWLAAFLLGFLVLLLWPKPIGQLGVSTCGLVITVSHFCSRTLKCKGPFR